MAGALNFAGTNNRVARIVDLAEVECLRRDGLSVSPSDVLIAMERGISGEEGAESAEARDGDADKVVDAFADVDARMEHCGGGYPFRRNGKAAERLAVTVEDGRQWHALLYLFLLWLTRTRESAPGNARALFEQLCRQVARNYWGGGEKVRAISFGAGGGFKAKLEKLARQLSDRGKIREESADGGRSPRDEGVDIVVFRPFADKRAGQVIGFGQCKSGHGYGRKELTECRPDAFVKNWLRPETVVESSFVRLFFLSDRIAGNELMFQYGNWAGVLFDRCRIMEHAADVDADLKGEIAAWILGRLEGEAPGILDRLGTVGIGRDFKAE